MARFDNIAGTTELTELAPEIIIPEITASAMRQEVFMPLVTRYDFTGPGDTFDKPGSPAVSFGAYTPSGTAPTEDAFDTTKRTLTPALYVVDVIITLPAWVNSQFDLRDEVVKEVAIAWASHRDGLFAALYTEAPSSAPDHEIGVDGTALDFADLTAAQELLYIQNAPKRFKWVVHPTQWGSELLADSTMIDASVKGAPVLTQGVREDGYLTSVLDTDIYMSDQIVESTGRHSMMFSPGALGYAYKRIGRPGGSATELMVDVDYDSARRLVEVNCSYFADAEGLKGSSTTTNNWMVDLIS